MTEIVTVIYENGVLRPLQPLRLRERQQITVQFLDVVQDEEIDERQLIIDDLIAAGIIEEDDPWPDVPDEDPVSPDRRAELAKLLGAAPGKPLSEIVIEDRGEW